MAKNNTTYILKASYFVLIACFAVFCVSAEVLALGKDGIQSKAPIEVTAEKEIEWDRAGRVYIARGSAKATQGKNSLEGDILRAYYSDKKTKTAQGQKTNINKIQADGHVVLRSDGNTAYGDKIVYDLVSGKAVLTGKNVILVTPKETITARDRITFNTVTNVMSADGNARLEQNKNILVSDQFIASFHDVGGTMALKEMRAQGNVVITTPDEVLKGDKGKYVAKTNVATIHGNVRIKRGPNTLTGTRASVNMNTRKSKLFGSGATSQSTSTDGVKTGEGNTRVRGVFYPQ